MKANDRDFDPTGDSFLSPTAVPQDEAWLYRNREASESVRNGLDQLKRGEIRSLGSFGEYAADGAE